MKFKGKRRKFCQKTISVGIVIYRTKTRENTKRKARANAKRRRRQRWWWWWEKERERITDRDRIITIRASMLSAIGSLSSIFKEVRVIFPNNLEYNYKIFSPNDFPFFRLNISQSERISGNEILIFSEKTGIFSIIPKVKISNVTRIVDLDVYLGMRK